MIDSERRGTVHIVDDDEHVRKALVGLCRSAGLRAIAHAASGDLPAQGDIERPACVVLDVRLPNESGLLVQERLRASGCTVPILFLTGFGTIPMTVQAMRNGAVEFLTKPVDDETLLEALRRALRQDEDSMVAEAENADLTARLRSLTAREREVLGLAIGGLMNKQIAGELCITEVTAKVHKRNVMGKMGARSLADLIRIAHQLGVAASRHR